MQDSAPDMYKQFYGFRDMPFSPAVNHNLDFIYLSQNYEASLAHLASNLEKKVPLTLVLGEDGVGKTTFINYAGKHVLQNSNLGLVNGQLKSAHELFRQTLASFGHQVKYLGTKEMLQQLRDIFSSEFEKQDEQPSVLIIDDANKMYIDALKGIEQLLALNSENKQLIQLILVGQPELEDLLNVLESDGLSKSVKTVCWLEALTADETQRYINHRLNLIGAVDKKLFDEQVCLAIYQYSKGLPRKINAICDEALLRSCAQQKHVVSTALIHESANDAQHESPPEAGSTRYKLRVSLTSENSRVDSFSKSALLTWLVLSGIILVLVVSWDGFFSVQEAPLIKVPNDFEVSPAKGGGREQIPEPKQINQLAERSNKLIQKPALSDSNQQNESTKQAAIANQLAIAERHFNAFSLKTSEGENALIIYRKILDRDPRNVIASQGIKRIAEKYVELAENKSRLGEVVKARRYLERAAVLVPESERIQKLIVQAEELQDLNKTAKATNQKPLEALKKSASLTDDDKIAQLLETAERQFAKLQLKFPEKDNAYETYSSILSIRPDDKRALDGLLRITNYYLDKAKKLHIEGNLDKSRLLIARGLRVSPDHHQLIALQQEIRAEVERAPLQKKIDAKKIDVKKIHALLNRADQQFALLNLILPHSDNAYQSYQEILAIDTNNRQAIKGIQDIQQQLQSQLHHALDKHDFGVVFEVADEILSIASGGNNSYLKEVAYEAIEAKKIVANQLENLLVLGKKQRKAKRFTKPADDNAFDTYHKALQIDPASIDAKEGLSKLVLEYQMLVNTALSDGNTSQALTAANEGLIAFPDNHELQALRDKVHLHQEAAIKQKNSSSKKKIDNTGRGLQTFGTF
jgi:type II secretory pathway predicted ATPase ExeA